MRVALVTTFVVAFAVAAVLGQETLTLTAPSSGNSVFQGGVREAEYVEGAINANDTVTIAELWAGAKETNTIRDIYPAMQRQEFTSYGYNDIFARVQWFVTEADGSWVEVAGRCLIQYLETFSSAGQQMTGVEQFYALTRASDPWVQHPRRPQWALDHPEWVHPLARAALLEGYGPVITAPAGPFSFGRDWTWVTEAFARYGPHAPLSNGLVAIDNGTNAEVLIRAEVENRGWTLDHGLDTVLPGFFFPQLGLPEVTLFQVRWHVKDQQMMESNIPTPIACAISPQFCQGAGIPGVSKRQAPATDAERVTAAQAVKDDASSSPVLKDAADRFLALSQAQREAAFEAALAMH